ncbi:MarR family transcriptional regulator [Spongiactinospora gelatinilytica]|uniref:MarR family transcriptional regulator n=1 Tax=Spongiactinospora gelatinilytica TaxID=2666298 RepID=A0A2W2HTJ1_9ACTN|nr:MarR family transcriptional regulator [Spongiactinospora gelatinilytica]
MFQVVRRHATLAHELLARIGVTPPQELVLLYLEDHGPVQQSELVRFLGPDRSTVSVTLGAMERAGLIARSPSETHRRAMLVRLTATGRDLCPRTRQVWAELEDRAFGGLTTAQRGELAAALAAVRDALDRK